MKCQMCLKDRLNAAMFGESLRWLSPSQRREIFNIIRSNSLISQKKRNPWLIVVPVKKVRRRT
jgi:hypothetical protein